MGVATLVRGLKNWLYLKKEFRKSQRGNWNILV